MSLWAELKRRNVVKVGIAYLTLAWIVIEATSMAVPALSLSPALNGIVFYLGLIGFPFAIFFAWAFELTPDGIIRAESVDPEKSVTQSTGKKLEHIIVGLLAIAVLFLVWENYIRSPEEQIIEPELVALVEEPPSVAVLPFVNMSSDQEQEYFSDGISEEILNVLAKIPGLHVTSRSSAFAFKGKDLDLKDVAKQLGVNHILEGSVRKAGDQVRITAQLIEANTDRHIWSETYDRELVDIFAIQDEISDAIVIVLKEKLMGKEEATPSENFVTSTTNPAAYTAYLQAFQLWRNSNNTADMFNAKEMVEQSISLDENYAPARSLHAAIYNVLTTMAYIPLEEGVPLARAEIERSIELDPNYARIYLVRAAFKEAFDFDFVGSRADLEKALSLNPNDAGTYRRLSRNSSTTGNFDQAIEEAKKAVALDPLNMNSLISESRVYTFIGDSEKALETVNIALSVNPDNQSLLLYHGYININLGHYEDALADAALSEDEAYRPQLRAMAYYGLGNQAASDENLAEIIQEASDDSAFQIAEIYGYRGDIENCLKWLDISYDQLDPGLQGLLVSQFLKSVHSEPRYLTLLEKMGLSPQ